MWKKCLLREDICQYFAGQFIGLKSSNGMAPPFLVSRPIGYYKIDKTAQRRVAIVGNLKKPHYRLTSHELGLSLIEDLNEPLTLDEIAALQFIESKNHLEFN